MLQSNQKNFVTIFQSSLILIQDQSHVSDNLHFPGDNDSDGDGLTDAVDDDDDNDGIPDYSKDRRWGQLDRGNWGR